MKILSLLYVCALIFSISAYSYSFYDQFPVEHQILDGRGYPQNYRYLYSGTGEKRLPLNDAVSAMLGTKEVFFASNTFVDVASCLMKKKACKKEIIDYWDLQFSGVGEVRRAYILGLVEKMKSQNGGAYDSWESATKASQAILDQYFSWLSYKEIYRNFVKFRSTVTGTEVNVVNEDGIAWPSETIYTSTLSWVSALYGPRTVIVHEKTPRSLDLGYWNLLNSGYWYGTARDMGEFISAGYLPGHDIVGYQIRHVTGGSFKPSKSKIGKRWQPEWHAIDFAFYLEKTSEGLVVVILRGEDSGCMERVKAFQYVFCTDVEQSLIKPGKLKDAKDNPDKLAYLAQEIRKDPTRFPIRNSNSRPQMVGLFKLQGQKTPSEYKHYSRRGTLSKGEVKWFTKKVLNLDSKVELVY